MWDIIKLLFTEVSPASKNKWTNGITFTWRAIGLIFFGYLYLYTQDRKKADLEAKKDRDTMMWDIRIMKLQNQTAIEYRTTDISQHNTMQNSIEQDERDIAEIKGYLGMRVKSYK